MSDGAERRTQRIQDATLLSVFAVVLAGWLALLIYVVFSLLS
jgi:hypothetical protein